MRFSIEQRPLTDTSGKPVAGGTAPVFHTFEAESVEDAVRLFVNQNDAEILGDVRTFPGFHAVATLRNTGGVYTIQVRPVTQNFVR